MKSVLVVSQDPMTYDAIRKSINSEYSTEKVKSANEAALFLKKSRSDFVFLDIGLFRADRTGREIKKTLQQFWQIYPTIGIVVMAPQDRIREAVTAVKAGASDYLTYPVDAEEIRLLIDGIYEQSIIQSELDYLRDHFWDADLDVVKTNNDAMRRTFDKIRSVAPTKSTVLLTGETGTGKSTIANLIHNHSNRKGESFISLHCGAIPDTLLESELFGHEKGAFTGAVKRKLGKFEIASGGTIFLDEIGTITPSAQIKLLHIIQDGTFERIGGEETIRADVRIIAATNSDLRKMCDDGAFRLDLYYRLNVFPIEIPPLKERKEDLPIFADAFIQKLNSYYQKHIRGIHPDVLSAFRAYDWPGNIRELENLIERAYILETSSLLTPESFPSELLTTEAPASNLPLDFDNTLKEFRQKSVEDAERRYLKNTLKNNHGRINDSAKAAGITTRQLSKLLGKYGIRKEEFKPVMSRRPPSGERGQ